MVNTQLDGADEHGQRVQEDLDDLDGLPDHDDPFLDRVDQLPLPVEGDRGIGQGRGDEADQGPDDVDHDLGHLDRMINHVPEVLTHLPHRPGLLSEAGGPLVHVGNRRVGRVAGPRVGDRLTARVEVLLYDIDACGDRLPRGNMHGGLIDVTGKPAGDLLPRVRTPDPDHQIADLVEDESEGDLRQIRHRGPFASRGNQFGIGRTAVVEPVGDAVIGDVPGLTPGQVREATAGPVVCRLVRRRDRVEPVARLAKAGAVLLQDAVKLGDQSGVGPTDQFKDLAKVGVGDLPGGVIPRRSYIR